MTEIIAYTALAFGLALTASALVLWVGIRNRNE